MEQELQQLKQSLENTQRETETLKRELQNLQTYGSQINVNLDNRSQDSFNREFTPTFRNQLRTEIFNAAWSNFHVAEIVPWASGTFTTNNQIGNAVQAGKQDTSEGLLLNYKRDSRLRTSIYFNSNPQGSTAYVGMTGRPSDAGTTTLHPNGSFTGFKIINGNVYGVNFLRGQEVVIDLGYRAVAQKVFVLEVRYFAGDRSDFYVNDVFIASLSRQINNIMQPDVFDLIRIYMFNTAAKTQTLVVEAYEFLQDRLS